MKKKVEITIDKADGNVFVDFPVEMHSYITDNKIKLENI